MLLDAYTKPYVSKTVYTDTEEFPAPAKQILM